MINEMNEMKSWCRTQGHLAYIKNGPDIFAIATSRLKKIQRYKGQNEAK